MDYLCGVFHLRVACAAAHHGALVTVGAARRSCPRVPAALFVGLDAVPRAPNHFRHELVERESVEPAANLVLIQILCACACVFRGGGARQRGQKVQSSI